MCSNVFKKNIKGRIGAMTNFNPEQLKATGSMQIESSKPTIITGKRLATVPGKKAMFNPQTTLGKRKHEGGKYVPPFKTVKRKVIKKRTQKRQK